MNKVSHLKEDHIRASNLITWIDNMSFLIIMHSRGQIRSLSNNHRDKLRGKRLMLAVPVPAAFCRITEPMSLATLALEANPPTYSAIKPGSKAISLRKWCWLRELQAVLAEVLAFGTSTMEQKLLWWHVSLLKWTASHSSTQLKLWLSNAISLMNRLY